MLQQEKTEHHESANKSEYTILLIQNTYCQGQNCITELVLNCKIRKEACIPLGEC